MAHRHSPGAKAHPVACPTIPLDPIHPITLAPSRHLRYLSPHMNSTEDEFFVSVAHALAGCQRVEQELKLYITQALELTKTCVGQKLPFKIRGEDFADSSLERLIDIFKKLSDDETHVHDLQQFRDERNFLSHKAITHCLDGGGRFCQETAFDLQDRLQAIQREAKRLSLSIFEKAAILGFDDLTDAG